MNLDLGDIFSRAWRITWNNKILWLFGVLAALGTGGGGANFNVNYRTSFPSLPSSESGLPSLPPEVGRRLDALQQSWPVILAAILGLICLLLLISLVVFALSLIGQGGLIGGARLANANGRVRFGETWALGRRYVWRLFLVNLPAILFGWLVGLIVLVIGIGAAAAIVMSARNADASPTSVLGGMFGVVFGVIACVVPLACVSGLVSLALRLLIFFARFAVVLEDLTPMAAFRRGWAVLVSNFASLLILGIILVVGGAVFGFIVALPTILFLAPLFIGFLGMVATGQAVSLAGGAIFALVCFAGYIPVLIFVRGVFETWATSVWTLAYAQSSAAPPPAPAPPYPLVPGGASV